MTVEERLGRFLKEAKIGREELLILLEYSFETYPHLGQDKAAVSIEIDPVGAAA